ncbi:unnamed protein product [Allacma fusca]|uniref:Sodefrin-like factor n=1 Tax=Allacma fusca TaxID=39272 RepID=A0A8J2KL94_9HEXA|nr:unnamed protein product [Allacma fusca]
MKVLLEIFFVCTLTLLIACVDSFTCISCGQLHSDATMRKCKDLSSMQTPTKIVTCSGPKVCSTLYIQTDSTSQYDLARRDCQSAFDIYTDNFGCYGPLENFSRFRNVYYCSCNHELCNNINITFGDELEILRKHPFVDKSLPPALAPNPEQIPHRINENGSNNQNAGVFSLTDYLSLIIIVGTCVNI